ncbi:Rv3654c family TadE-like protein [Planobispora longispora]|uniref:Putative Flp pilus-assembly TadG-like N-terminal domain-containing protein n=1 Tax=Planobispora longispora TaxID=28887 RepID=A0A8J3W887_9ACTN|nr:hypothetical protein Plo01_68180 [Planobispora longispora]
MRRFRLPEELRSRERGSATIWMIGVAAVVFTAAVAVTIAGSARAARHRVQAAADFGALAAARLALADPARGCAEAALLAAENDARLTRCDIGADGVAVVRTTVRLSLPVVGDREIMAHARAGPVHIAGPPTTGEPSVWPGVLIRPEAGDADHEGGKVPIESRLFGLRVQEADISHKVPLTFRPCRPLPQVGRRVAGSRAGVPLMAVRSCSRPRSEVWIGGSRSGGLAGSAAARWSYGVPGSLGSRRREAS